jgi:oligopeptidase B
VKASKSARIKPDVPPSAKQRPQTRVVHGETIVDDYAWLRDANWREVMRDPSRLDPEIRAYLEAENAYAKEGLAPLDELKRKLIGEMRGRIKEDDSSVPARDGPFAYSIRYREGGQHPLLYRQPAEGGPEQLLLDGDELAKGYAYFQLGGGRHSPDHKLLAWSADDAGSEYFKVRVRDMASGSDIADIVPDTTGSVVWTADARAFFYVRRDEEHRPTRVFLHRLGTLVEADRLVYDEPDKGFFIDVSELQAGEFAAISGGDHETSEVHLLDLRDPDAAPRLVAARKHGERYDVEHHPDLGGEATLVIHTNADGAEDFKVVLAPLESPDRANWRELIPHRPGTLLLVIGLLRDWLVRLEREDGLPRIVVRGSWTARSIRSLSPKRPIRSAWSAATNSTPTSALFLFVDDDALEVWDYDMRSRERVAAQTPGGAVRARPGRLCHAALLAPADDGETVPISILYRAASNSTARSAPALRLRLLWASPSRRPSAPIGFRWSTAASSMPSRISAAAPTRAGAGIAGQARAQDQHLPDFIAAAEHLIAKRFTEAGRIVAHGGSAGGMLMGAVANMRPDLFGGIHRRSAVRRCAQHHARRHAAAHAAGMERMGQSDRRSGSVPPHRGYSPYDNVKAQDYPSMLVLAGLTDPRVTYWEPAKWVARLRALKTDQNPLWLRTNMDAGHGGAAGRFDRLEEVALGYVFALRNAGVA